MRIHLLEWQRRFGAWCAARAPERDDRGAVSTETAIITALVGVAAVGLATFLAGNILDWQGTIPTP
jgi:Flp pilus assembly pilin Flp